MKRFVTIDLNGWLDHILLEDGTAKSLGIRSCLFNYENPSENVWLFGAQALAAARHQRSEAPLIDAIDALGFAAGHGDYTPNEREALPKALWQLVLDAARLADRSLATPQVRPALAPKSDRILNIAVVIPDGRYLGRPKVQEDGKTNLETLHKRLLDARPPELRRSNIELIWRSVAALRAIKKQHRSKPGSVLIISVNRRVFWTVLELRHWSRTGGSVGQIRIVRKPIMNDCTESESWTAQRVLRARSALEATGECNTDKAHRWTRLAEVLATDISKETWKDLGIDAEGIENLSWPTEKGVWDSVSELPSINWTVDSIPPKLAKQIKKFKNGIDGSPLGIVIENPVGKEMDSVFVELVKKEAGPMRIWRVTGNDTICAAAKLAKKLGRDPNAPAWLDEVPGIDLEVKNARGSSSNEASSNWLPIIPSNEAISAGETYHSRPNKKRRVKLAPGIEHVHLHLRRGEDERFSGHSTGHTINPSDNERIVEPLARVRPLSAEAQVEIIEHLPDGTAQAVAASSVGIKWSDMAKSKPVALRSIPELYVFKASREGWRQLKPLLEMVVRAGAGNVSFGLKNTIYQLTQQQWKDNMFPLGSDGELPRKAFKDPAKFQAARVLLRESTTILLHDLQVCTEKQIRLQSTEANRLHLPLTWLFVGCPERAAQILLEAILNPNGTVGRTLHMDNQYSSWSVYQGFGRSVKNKNDIRAIFDQPILDWKSHARGRQDKFLLAAISHPMARRVAVRNVLNEDKERFKRVKGFLDRQLKNILEGAHDSRPSRSPSLELRYVTMGYRGLCQIRYSRPKWFPIHSKDCKKTYDRLRRATETVRPPHFVRDLVERTAPYLIGEGEDPTMPGGF